MLMGCMLMNGEVENICYGFSFFFIGVHNGEDLQLGKR
jgi:hypothetical protein